MKVFEMLVWPGGGTIGLVIWVLSVVMVSVMVENFITIRRRRVMPTDVLKEIHALFAGKKYREVIELTASEPSFLSHAVHAALTEAPHGYAAMARAMEEAAEERTTKMLRHVEWLNLIGNISPMLGLIGTVWGMILAFMKFAQIAEMGQTPTANHIAREIGIALITTLLGLGVAIPSLAVYAVMRNRIDELSSEALLACQELIGKLRPVKKAEEK